MKKYFLTGLVTLLPLAVTIWAVYFAMNILTKPFIGMVMLLTNHLPISSQKLTETLSQIGILITLFLLTLFVGFVARKFFFVHILRLADQALSKVPLVNKVYKTCKEIVKALFSSGQSSFQQVVLIPFPHPGSYSLGLISRESPSTCSHAEGTSLISIFIPTTPNPTTGFLVLCPESELIYLKMKPEEAIKYVVSCGVIQPAQETISP